MRIPHDQDTCGGLGVSMDKVHDMSPWIEHWQFSFADLASRDEFGENKTQGLFPTNFASNLLVSSPAANRMLASGPR